LYPWGWSRTKQLEPNEKTEHLRIGKIILKNFPGYKIGRGYDLLKYIAIGASDDFYHEYFGATAFTFEGVSRREKEKFTEHTRMWSDLLADQARKASRQGGLVPGGEIPKVAVLRSSDTGIWLGVSGSPGVSSVALCRGSDATPCHPSRSVVGFAFSYFNGERKVFQSLSEVNVLDADSFTVELFNSKSESIGRTKIRLSRR
jgi:hypothetical protein